MRPSPLVVALPALAAPAGALSKAEAFERAAPATVFIVAPDGRGAELGAGAIVAPRVKVGQDMVAIGNPQGLAWTLRSGSTSALRKGTLRTETAINPGNFGGPLLGMKARTDGISTCIRRDSIGE